jgi:hypothetical protein
MNTTVTAVKMSASLLQPADQSAIKAALALARHPSHVRRIPRNDIPADVITLIKIAAGDDDLLLRLSADHNVPERDLLAASKLYLHSILSSAKTNDRRMLCLPRNASADDIREHKKALLKWLHPDRNHDRWESALFAKVNEASIRLQKSPGLVESASPSVVISDKHRRKRRSEQRRHAMAGYQKAGWTAMMQHAARPVLFVGVMALAVYILTAVLSTYDVRAGKLFSNFAFTTAFD